MLKNRSRPPVAKRGAEHAATSTIVSRRACDSSRYRSRIGRESVVDVVLDRVELSQALIVGADEPRQPLSYRRAVELSTLISEDRFDVCEIFSAIEHHLQNDEILRTYRNLSSELSGCRKSFRYGELRPAFG